MAASGGVRQVTRSNFPAALRDIRSHLDGCDFVAIAPRKTGDLAAGAPSWRRLLPVDTSETAYLKAKLAAESFELLQLAVCPFRLRGSKVVAFPYNFHLFPRDELNVGMPSYSFSCQTSYLSSMAKEGFDFNLCIYDGISYLSRVQETLARGRNPIPQVRRASSCATPSVADSVFMGRIKSRVENWRKACKEPNNKTDGALINSLRKLILGSEIYGSRPCLSIDVCSDRQVQLVLETINNISEDLVAVVVPDKGVNPKVVRVVFTSSEEDKNLLMNDLHDLENEQNLKLRGFREVIDLISASHKPIVSYNCLHDLTFIHSKFLAPLPPSLCEFKCSLKLVFSNVLDIGHLMKEIGPLRKAKSIPAALSYLRRQFFVPIDMEVPSQVDSNHEKNQGHKVLSMTRLFAKLINCLKIDPYCEAAPGREIISIEDHANNFYPHLATLQDSEEEEDATVGFDAVRKVSSDHLVFLWGFGQTSINELRHQLMGSHSIFLEGFELKLIGKTCAVVVFWKPGAAEELMKQVELGAFSDGLKAADFGAYKKVCRLGLWDADLAGSLQKVASQSASGFLSPSEDSASEIYWNSETMLDPAEYLES